MQHSGLEPGRVIGGKYRLVRALGSGGMGAVFQAEHVAIGRHVAIKLLHREFAINTDIVARFQREAAATARIGHPGIVAVFDLDREPDGTLYMVQELLEGADLKTWLAERGRLPPHEALAIAVPVAEALAAAHERGILHRDIKPANIFLARGAGEKLQPKLIDFGVAKILVEEGGRAGADSTRAGMMVGTLGYMSPEQFQPDLAIDARADVWALGVVLHEMLAGQTPFAAPHNQSDLVAVARFAEQVIHGPVPRIENMVPGLPAGVCAVVQRALESDRERRYATMRELLGSLEACSLELIGGGVSGESTPGHPLPGDGTSASRTMGRDAAPTVISTASAAAAAARSQVRRVVVAALVVVALAAAATVLLQRGPHASAPLAPISPVAPPPAMRVDLAPPGAPPPAPSPASASPTAASPTAPLPTAPSPTTRRAASRSQRPRPPAEPAAPPTERPPAANGAPILR